ncbi:MAG: phosphoglucomutase/phosphomannomutase family protein [Candidatus Caenarcaniphilales bacterium]|nr:phosphoglucomutase/phosphomannomutase family protein [Candidatus Caenarcaniphilales bacterium]
MTWKKIRFGTDGWRGIIADDFTYANVSLAAAAIARYMDETYSKEKPALISYDARFLADQFARKAAEVINSFGREVLIVDRDTPTPVIAHAAKDLKSAGALQFTASHNPPEYCGIKYIPDYAGPANEKITARISDFVKEMGESGWEFISDTSSKATTQIFSPKEAYCRDLSKLIDLHAINSSRLKIGYDSLCGVGRGYIDQLIKCEVVLGIERDVLFRGMNPEPSADSMCFLISKVKEHQLDLGIANDGDADRFGVIGEGGIVFTPNQILIMLVRYLCEERNLAGSVVRTISTTHALDALCEKLELNLIETPVGFKYVGQAMCEKEVLLGGEESGGLSILGHIPEKDGILACLLVCEMLAKTGKSLQVLWQEAIQLIGFEPAFKRLDLHLPNETKIGIIQGLKTKPPEKLGRKKVLEVKTGDGVKILLENGDWILVRASGTEPLLRIYAESKSPEDLRELLEATETFFKINSALSSVH